MTDPLSVHPRSKGGSARGRQLSARRVLDLLSASIREGHISPDEPLAEEDLMTLLDSSRGAVRAALHQLAAIGFVERRPKFGTRINQSWVRIPIADVQDADARVLVEVVEQRMVRTSPLLRERLCTDAAEVRMVENLFVVERPRTVLGLRTAYFDPEFAMDPAEWFHEPLTMDGVLAGFFSRETGGVTVTIGSEVADERTARMLGVAERSALTVRDILYSAADGTPIETVFDRFRGDLVQLAVSATTGSATIALDRVG